MRMFLVAALLTFGSLAAVEYRPTQDPPPVQEPARLELTPAEVELIKHYLDLRAEEMKANPTDFTRIRQKYDDLVRRALPPEKYPLAQVLLGC